MSLGKTIYVEKELGENMQNVSQIQTMSALITGVGAGVLGLTNIAGVVFFFLGAAFTSLMIITLGCENAPERYFPSGRKQLFSFGSLISGSMTYVLAWTVAYDAVYIF